MRSATQPSIFAVTSCFLKIGFLGFGGLGGVLSLLQRDLVERRGWLCEAEVVEALTYTKLLPGSTIVQVVAYLGWKLRGLGGALVATTGFLLPAFLVMVIFAEGYSLLTPYIRGTMALTGLVAAVVGILILTTWTLGRKNITGFSGLVVALVSLIASVRFGVNPAVLVVAAGLWGILVETNKELP